MESKQATRSGYGRQSCETIQESQRKLKLKSKTARVQLDFNLPISWKSFMKTPVWQGIRSIIEQRSRWVMWLAGPWGGGVWVWLTNRLGVYIVKGLPSVYALCSPERSRAKLWVWPSDPTSSTSAYSVPRKSLQSFSPIFFFFLESRHWLQRNNDKVSSRVSYHVGNWDARLCPHGTSLLTTAQRWLIPTF